jgi:hypothetical protein
MIDMLNSHGDAYPLQVTNIGVTEDAARANA